MGREVIKYTIMFVGLVLTQVLFLNQVQVSGFVNPYIYILFILLLPLNAPRYVVLLGGFFVGLSVDIFSNTMGIHAFASVFIAFLRPLIVRAITDREEDRSDYPGLAQNGFSWFLYYTALMVFLHHSVLFFIEVFTLSDFFGTLYRIILSSLFSIFVIVLSQFIVFRD
ncbi:rod shape-determining protein MreD [Draconibacterium sp. IB214405]|uniref:rod shape-determining protein MreD n=1 Tax=Draconibacterium sp. IB214405 TaxID=3097352 RepID=UPI002A10588F|nr:rod shape-determining protein MreD [Draconibacterium sp. IB214405]MDX8340983.1 rod shape-determining protein MreD [Draconibacterium sp. IB214405]